MDASLGALPALPFESGLCFVVSEYEFSAEAVPGQLEKLRLRVLVVAVGFAYLGLVVGDGDHSCT